MFRLFADPTKTQMPKPENALPGRAEIMPVADTHRVLGTPMSPPWEGMDTAIFGLGCFWGAERVFWQLEGVHSTQVGYAAGFTQNPTYPEVCSGRTGHNEVVRVVFDPNQISFARLLEAFWESHDPTQGMRQGNDVGTQYRSGIYCSTEAQIKSATVSREAFKQALQDGGYGEPTTEILELTEFFYAEDEHQQYLHKNPGGYCGLGGSGVQCPTGIPT